MEINKEQRMFLKHRQETFMDLENAKEYKSLFSNLEKLIKNSMAVPMIESNFKELKERGYLKETSNKFIKGKNGQCHSNSALYALRNDNYKICTGYAYTEEDGLWRQHSWLLNSKGDILETTKIKRDFYFGFELNKEETKLFIDENY